MILDTDAYIYDAANFVTNGRTTERTDKAILGVGYAKIGYNPYKFTRQLGGKMLGFFFICGCSNGKDNNKDTSGLLLEPPLTLYQKRVRDKYS